MSIEKILASAPVVPVVVIEKLEDAAPLARALYNGGLKALEITLRTPVAVEAVKLMKAEVPEAYILSFWVDSTSEQFKQQAIM